MEFSLGEPFEVRVIHRHDLPGAMVGLATHVKPEDILGLGVGEGHFGFITLAVDLGHGGSRGDHQELGIVQVEQLAFHAPPYLGLEGLK